MKLACAAAIATLALPGAASAAPVLWTLSGVAFSDGGTASGSFVYDADANTYSSINITTTAGSVRGSAVHGRLHPDPHHHAQGAVFTTSAGATTGAPLFQFSLQAPLTNAGGSTTIMPGPSVEAACDVGCTGYVAPFRSVVAGAMTGTPVPAAVPTLSEWAMILLAALLAGGAALTLSRRPTAA